jgi:hypothetical protein
VAARAVSAAVAAAAVAAAAVAVAAVAAAAAAVVVAAAVDELGNGTGQVMRCRQPTMNASTQESI